MGVYLEDHEPARSQYRNPRRAAVTGAVVVHDTESAADQLGDDSGAEAVAAFISRRTDGAGSYHTLVDSDSIVRVGRYEWEMFGEGTGGNRYALHLSMAYKKAEWATLPDDYRHRTLANAAKAAADMARWAQETEGITIPAKHITPAEYRAGKPGFVGHGELDPDRRSDPGWGDDDWAEFLALYAAEMNPPAPTIEPPPTTTEEARMGIYSQAMSDIDALYLAYQGEVEPGTPGHAERIKNLRIWGRDLAHRVLVNGEDPAPSVRFLALHLAAADQAGQ